ncbi:MAG TPA: site-specific DNA-methyltransferase [Desulfomonilaceae bacterium]|nr:site-specific DNA-methyltransferase [Desulfomonilaceae bacterium]
MARKKKTDSPALVADQELPVAYAELTGPGAGIVLYKGDCLAGMSRILEPDSVDVIVTSPPYNIGIRYGRYDDGIPRDAYLEWMGNWAKLVRRVLKPDGSLFLNIGSKPSDPWIPYDVANQLRSELCLQNVINWVKSIHIENSSYGREIALSVGHYKPINSKRYLNDAHEYIFHFTRTGSVNLDRVAIGVPYKDASNITRWKSAAPNLRCRGNNWYIPYSTIQNRAADRPHPASFPSELPQMCIKLHGLKKVAMVLDPFLGIGNTAVACARLGVPMVGFEIDEEYLRTAVKAVKDERGQLLMDFGPAS